MSPNSENPMALLLYAILKQKNLKDIDWNQVAQDPHLPEPVSNGHAARMRFFRFRNSVEGMTHRRGRPAEGNGVKDGRVSKPKKQPQRAKRDVMIKSEMSPSMSPYGQFSPASTNTSPYLGDTLDEFDDRFSTPFSDDMSAHSGGRKSLTIDPAVAHNFPPLPIDCGSANNNHNFIHTAGSDFEAAFDMTAGDFLHTANMLDMPDGQHLGDCGSEWVQPFP
jgi:hypothetical protein